MDMTREKFCHSWIAKWQVNKKLGSIFNDKIVKNIITDKNYMVKLRYSEKGTKFEKKSPTYLFWRLFTQ